MTSFDFKPCPFCGAKLEQENRINPRAKTWEFPFITFYVHPRNGCLLEGMEITSEQKEKWNVRRRGKSWSGIF